MRLPRLNCDRGVIRNDFYNIYGVTHQPSVTMPKKQLPRFVIYQPNQKEFHLCLEVGGEYLRWCSYYAPTADVRFARELTRIENRPLTGIPKKQVYDEGTYATTKAATKDEVEERLGRELEGKSASFVLEGKKLHGRYSIKHARGATVLQKFKDKYAVEEDVLAGDLSRTISTMIPDYDPSKIVLEPTPRTRSRKAAPPEPEPEEVEEEITADKKIGKTVYHFAFYMAEDEPDICLVTSEAGEVLVLVRRGRRWVALPGAGAGARRHVGDIVEHAEALGLEGLEME